MILPFDALLRHHGPGSIIKSTPAGMKRAANIAARLATEGIAEAILVEEVRFSVAELHALHMRVIEEHYGWLGQHAVSVTGSEGDVRTNAVIVDVEVPLSEEVLAITQARWGSDVRLRFSPGSRMMEQQLRTRAATEHPPGG